MVDVYTGGVGVVELHGVEDGTIGDSGVEEEYTGGVGFSEVEYTGGVGFSELE